MPTFKYIRDLSNQASQGAQTQGQEKQIDALKAQSEIMKAQNEKQKVTLEVLKADSEAKIARAKLIGETAEKEAKIRKSDLEGLQIKSNIIDQQSRLEIDQQQPLVKPAQAKPTPEPKPAPQPPQPPKGPEGPKGPQVTQFGQPQPTQAQQQRQQPSPLPPLPQLQKNYMQALQEQAEGIKSGLQASEMLGKLRVHATKRLKEANQQYQSRIMKNLELEKQLASNPPTYKSAMSNVNWLAKVVSVMDSAMLGHTRESPTYMIDQFVQREYQDQLIQFKSKQAYLQKEKTAYAQFYALNKDSYEAEVSTLGFLYGTVENHLKTMSSLADNQGKQMMLVQAVQDAEQKRQMAYQQFQHKVKYDAQEQSRKGFEADTKRIEAETNRIVGLAKLEQTQMKQQRELDIRTINFGNLKITDLAKPEKTKEVLSGAKTTFRDTRGVMERAKKVSAISVAKSKLAWIPGTKLGHKERENIKNLQRSLIKAMLKERINFTGGGNMATKEYDRLKDFYNVKEGNIFLKNDQELIQILTSKWSGDYEALTKLLQEDAFNTAWGEMDKSNTFENLSDAEKFKRIAEKLRLTDKEATRIAISFSRQVGRKYR